jgi:Sigma-70, region 4
MVKDELPAYGSTAFWRLVEEPGIPATMSLSPETLVKYARVALELGDDVGRKRILEVIIRYTASGNEQWVNRVLEKLPLGEDERKALSADLCADLCEAIIRAVTDSKRGFWEENFLHCLKFERKHVYRSFMLREGRWNDVHVQKSDRIPRAMVESLDHSFQKSDDDIHEYIEDEMAAQALLAVEHTDLPHLVLRLPDTLKPVILLIFWEGRTEKETARVLKITDRTVRNRLHHALKILRGKLASEREYVHG